MILKKLNCCLGVMLSLLTIQKAFAQADDEEALRAIYGDRTNVSIATGSKQSINRAPAVASVITAEEIAAMGATNLAQVLASIPGLQVGKQPIGGTVLSFRGDYTFNSSRVLRLVNGISINQRFANNNGVPDQAINIENIERIEVVRGSGSALYGADAFSGVINIITKNASNFKGTQFGTRIGQFNTREAWILQSSKWGDFDAAFFIRHGRSDGQNSIIESDLQTAFDTAFGTNVSHAPGRLNAQIESTDLQADISNGDWRLRTAWRRGEYGVGVGIADSLDLTTKSPSEKLSLNLSYQKTEFLPNWDVMGVFSWQDVKQKLPDQPYEVLPRGTIGGAFPNGLYGAPGRYERFTELGFSALYSGFQNHRIRLGTGAKIEDLYHAPELKNFYYDSSNNGVPVLTPFPAVRDVTNDPNFVYLLPHKRNLKYFLIQDEWTLGRSLSSTIGVRYDKYSDFGKTVNPRFALVWDANYNLVIKAIHNRAFRAPSSSEQYNVNNPVLLGNPKIRPEKIVSNELVLSWNLNEKLKTNLNLFHYKMSDIIQKVPNENPLTGSTAQNKGSRTGRGFEFDAEWNPSYQLRLIGSLSYQKTIDDAIGKDAGLAPHKRLYVRADWRFAPSWTLSTNANYVAGRKREHGDTRPQIADYTIVDAAISRERLFRSNWDLKLSVQNLFNRNAREPSFAPGNVPNDLPLPSRSFFVQVNYKL